MSPTKEANKGSSKATFLSVYTVYTSFIIVPAHATQLGTFLVKILDHNPFIAGLVSADLLQFLNSST